MTATAPFQSLMGEGHQVTPQEEAAQIFSEVLRELTSPNCDLKLILRRCQHACQLLDWREAQQWFQRELGGYPAEIPVPPHRQVPGHLTWRPRVSPFEQLERTTARFYGLEDQQNDRVPTTLDVRAGIDFVLLASQSGYTEVSGETEQRWSKRLGRTVTFERIRVFSAASFRHALSETERITFDFVSQAYSVLRYGNVLTDFWFDYRRRVDAVLQGLNLTTHLDAIQSGLQSPNQESWRNALFGCRNLLNDVANHLWRDTRKRYEYLSGRDGRGLEVTQGKFANRLAAYVHQKGLSGTRGKFLRDEVERFAVSIRSLIELQSEAHEPIARQDAITVALATYLILGELVTKTDMQPIEEYGRPAEPTELSGTDR